MTFLALAAMIFSGVAKGKDNITLPLKVLLPYDYSQKLAFTLTYLSQSVCLYFAALINVATETFVMTMIIQICSQLDIICHRLQYLSDDNENKKSLMYQKIEEANIIKDCVIHHNYIFSLSIKKEVNDKVIVQSIILTFFHLLIIVIVKNRQFGSWAIIGITFNDDREEMS
ncbi:uncharacterized protein LOC122512550 [Leptopilina heterotoma]|uniref:uncharacterized protein LOC122512550 n=1 Tax=Leptopilina heterotoma TaxID=63436 RepID=UPI001CA9297D|nr:uncharacterized protein LOC122512550 [Leptopilina heterotoma]